MACSRHSWPPPISWWDIVGKRPRGKESLVKEKEFLADPQGNLGFGPTAAAIKLGHHPQTMSPVTESLSS